MAIIDDLIKQIKDDSLRERIRAEVDKLLRQKKFGLVFENHLPECTPLYEVPVKVGGVVSLKKRSIDELYVVKDIQDEQALCVRKGDGRKKTFPLKNLVPTAEFGEPIYPYLKLIDSLSNTPGSDLWHSLIEADNYHALQLLEYLYAGKVDCIYIDPPYNTGARDWKYNNDYVDSSDSYRHSKWLAMMEKRLKLAKKLLNPEASVLICTIDEKEYLHLGCLLEELFPEAHTQMVSIVNNPNGVARASEFARVDEFAFFVFIGAGKPEYLEDPLFTSDAQMKKTGKATDEDNNSKRTKVRWERLLRGGTNSKREHSPGCFYPVYIDPVKRCVAGVGEALSLSVSIEEVPPPPDGLVAVWPIARGTRAENCWRTTPENFRQLVAEGYAKVGAYDKKRGRWTLLYLGQAQRKRIARGELIIVSRDKNGVVEVEESEHHIVKTAPKTIWNRQSHSAGEYGSRLLKKILPDREFPFPKSLYAVADCLRVCVANKPNALVIDFFAGSGTTLHAVNLLNAGDGGRRRCVMVTNNEVSEREAKRLAKQKYQPGDEEWEKLGIARYVTWPRTVCSIEGHDINGEPLKGKYLESNLPMAAGFEANAIYFKLGFLDKTSVALGRQFRELLPILWMKTGAAGACPQVEGKGIPTMLILPNNRFAVLTDEKLFLEFSEQIKETPEIETVFIVTDSEPGYREMAAKLKVKTTYQLYKDYLENFRINTVRI